MTKYYVKHVVGKIVWWSNLQVIQVAQPVATIILYWFWYHLVAYPATSHQAKFAIIPIIWSLKLIQVLPPGGQIWDKCK